MNYTPVVEIERQVHEESSEPSRPIGTHVKQLRVFLAAACLKVLIFIWIGYFGFPRTDGDNIFFLQPAYMYLFHGSPAIPTMEGRLPHVYETFGAYPPGYTAVGLLMFKLFGFSMPTMLWMDIVIHILLSVVFSLLLLFLLGNAYVAGLFLLSASFLVNPRGRPDELGVLFVCAATLLFLWRRKMAIAGAVLGVAFLTQPIIGFVGALILSWMHFELTKSFRSTVVSMLLAFGVSAAVASTLWLLVTNPEISKSFEQFVAHLSFRHAPKPARMITQIPTWGMAFLMTFVVSTAGAWLCLLKYKSGRNISSFQYTALKFLAVCLPIVALVQLAASSPHYSYRLLSYGFLAGSFLVLTVLFRMETMRDWFARTSLAIATIALAGVLLVAHHEIVRYALLPLSWNKANVRWEEALETVKKYVPQNAMVGGDPVFWWAIADGRPFYSLGWYKGEALPDFILSGTFWGAGGQTDVLMRPGWPSRIRESYDEIALPESNPTPASLRLGPVVIPVSRSSAADWRVRIWKRKDYQR